MKTIQSTIMQVSQIQQGKKAAPEAYGRRRSGRGAEPCCRWPTGAKGQQIRHPWLQNSQPLAEKWDFKHCQKQHMQIPVLKQLYLSLGGLWGSISVRKVVPQCNSRFCYYCTPLSLQPHSLSFCCMFNPAEVRNPFIYHIQLLWKWAQYPWGLESGGSDLIAHPRQTQTPMVNVQTRNK